MIYQGSWLHAFWVDVSDQDGNVVLAASLVGLLYQAFTGLLGHLLGS
jgi:hypothetical protein